MLLKVEIPDKWGGGFQTVKLSDTTTFRSLLKDIVDKLSKKFGEPLGVQDFRLTKGWEETEPDDLVKQFFLDSKAEVFQLELIGAPRLRNRSPSPPPQENARATGESSDDEPAGSIEGPESGDPSPAGPAHDPNAPNVFHRRRGSFATLHHRENSRPTPSSHASATSRRTHSSLGGEYQISDTLFRGSDKEKSYSSSLERKSRTSLGIHKRSGVQFHGTKDEDLNLIFPRREKKLRFGLTEDQKQRLVDERQRRSHKHFEDMRKAEKGREKTDLSQKATGSGHHSGNHSRRTTELHSLDAIHHLDPNPADDFLADIEKDLQLGDAEALESQVRAWNDRERAYTALQNAAGSGDRKDSLMGKRPVSTEVVQGTIVSTRSVTIVSKSCLAVKQSVMFVEDTMWLIFTQHEAAKWLAPLQEGAAMVRYKKANPYWRWFEVVQTGDSTDLVWRKLAKNEALEIQRKASARDAGQIEDRKEKGKEKEKEKWWVRGRLQRESVSDITGMFYGAQWSDEFRRYLKRRNQASGYPWMCFTVDFPTRSLDIACTDVEQLTTWLLGLQALAPLTRYYLTRGALLWQRLIMKLNYYGFEAAKNGLDPEEINRQHNAWIKPK